MTNTNLTDVTFAVDPVLDFESWREGAACMDRSDVDFFPDADDLAAVAVAKAVCAGCPVADDCLSFALETNQPDGIWGGYLAPERMRLRRRWMKDLREAS